jgi:radical SAM superfamily enzyme YgiQ (UPF0313 family)
MRVLLLAMPDVASSFDRVMRFPNLGLTSLAGNLDHAEVRILDLVTRAREVGRAVRETVREFAPEVVGLSAMTFQYHTARQVAALVRQTQPAARIVLGGYHATLASEQIATDPEAEAVDFLVRGEGEVTLNRLVQALRRGANFADIPGLSYRTQTGFVHNASAPLLEMDELRLPARTARVGAGFHYFGKPFDVVETSRGCTRACRFCCIHRMYGAHYRAYRLERVLEDIRAAAEAGARGIFFSDDNLNLDADRLLALCHAIVESGLSHLEYISQADVAGFARAPHLAPAMQRAGFTTLFLGIESVARGSASFLRKSNTLEQTQAVIDNLRGHGLAVAGGLIVGNPNEGALEVHEAFRTARTLEMDHAIMWCLTPYPGTEVREELMAEGLVTNPSDFRWYNGYICNVRTRQLTHRQLVHQLASEGLKLYFHPQFLRRSRLWGHEGRQVRPFLGASLEYLTHGYRNRQYASRHRM